MSEPVETGASERDYSSEDDLVESGKFAQKNKKVQRTEIGPIRPRPGFTFPETENERDFYIFSLDQYNRNLPFDELKREFERKIERKEVRSVNDLSADEQEAFRKLGAARVSEYRKRMSPEKVAEARAQKAAHMRDLRKQMSPEKAAEERAQKAAHMRDLRARRKEAEGLLR